MKMAVMDSLTHRFSWSKWPITMQRQRTATNNEIGTTSWACSLAMFFVNSETTAIEFLHNEPKA